MYWIKAFQINEIDVTKKFLFRFFLYFHHENTNSNDGCALTADVPAIDCTMVLLKASIIVTGSVETKMDMN